MKRVLLLLSSLALPLVLAACESAVNANVTTIDLTNTTVANANTAVVNTNSATNVNSVANTNAATNVNAVVNANTNTSAKVAATAVTITASGFSPATVTVKAGTTVTWTNNSGSNVQVASDPHPTHTTLPGLESDPLPAGGTYSFTFTQVGSWGYHDHFSPTARGTVTVQ